mmetsp:Transcript_16303/g.48443  ORF Transcript_16303/g.48443 Transcript_16303/m.48443 type:complete len:286 (-) Transcript_16303:493-1350(-)
MVAVGSAGQRREAHVRTESRTRRPRRGFDPVVARRVDARDVGGRVAEAAAAALHLGPVVVAAGRLARVPLATHPPRARGPGPPRRVHEVARGPRARGGQGDAGPQHAPHARRGEQARAAPRRHGRAGPRRAAPRARSRGRHLGRPVRLPEAVADGLGRVSELGRRHGCRRDGKDSRHRQDRRRCAGPRGDAGGLVATRPRGRARRRRPAPRRERIRTHRGLRLARPARPRQRAPGAVLGRGRRRGAAGLPAAALQLVGRRHLSTRREGHVEARDAPHVHRVADGT